MAGPRKPKGIPAKPPVRTPEQIARAAAPRVIEILETDSELEREMKMMRFILKLPIIDIKLLPKEDRKCGACDKPYSREWKIDNPETAVLLPCGHIVGHFCIREWLLPSEKNQRSCPHVGCDIQFPCAMDPRLQNRQTIVEGRLRPSPFLGSPDRKGFIAPITEEDESDDGDADDDSQASIITKIHIDDRARTAHASDVENKDSTRQLRSLFMSPELSNNLEQLTVQEPENASASDNAASGESIEILGGNSSIDSTTSNVSSAAAASKKSSTKAQGSWRLLRNVLRMVGVVSARKGQ